MYVNIFIFTYIRLFKMVTTRNMLREEMLAKRGKVYVATLRSDLMKKQFFKLGYTYGEVRNRIKQSSFYRNAPRGYKCYLKCPDNIQVLYVMIPSEKSILTSSNAERAFHKTHKEQSRIGEWYPMENLKKTIDCFLFKYHYMLAQ